MQIRSKKGKFKEEIFGALDMESQFILHPEEENELRGEFKQNGKCIKRLIAEQQKCVRLFFLDEKCYKEIHCGDRI